MSDPGPADTDDRPPDTEELTAASAAASAARYLAELTTARPLAATSVEPSEESWIVEVEVLEDRRIPSSADRLALYRVDVALDGTLQAYRRVGRYGRDSSDPTCRR
ncbi:MULTISPECIES: gas vesicle protein GvpO [Rhodococcus]|uniref:gas vesicle protein GvpO n=1 Tax=Rhodococcus TaxID=1827 RepID=UPI00193C7C8F|nr:MULTISPECIES: gas vesicle protein GvpO [Rhodococcus]QRI75108.1 gas vesicle protein [Rhodococcus aetherivorans]QSE58516.1 gas vesicle protein [Rhodococcus sp. PSBB066]QSE70159.1 gas vesicle protein [Rhodococcus sp. PSBB049]